MSGTRYRSNKQVDKTQILWPSAAMVAELKTNPRARLKPRGRQRHVLLSTDHAGRVFTPKASPQRTDDRISFTAPVAQPEKIAETRKTKSTYVEFNDALDLFSIENLDKLIDFSDEETNESTKQVINIIEIIYYLSSSLIERLPAHHVDGFIDNPLVKLLISLRNVVHSLIPLHVQNTTEYQDKCIAAKKAFSITINAYNHVINQEDREHAQQLMKQVDGFIALKQQQLKTQTTTIKKEETMALSRLAGNKAASIIAAAPEAEAPAPQTLQEYLKAFETALNTLIADAVREATLNGLTPKLNVLFYELEKRIETMRENGVSDEMILNDETGDRLQQLYSLVINIDPVKITDEEIGIALAYLDELEKEIALLAFAKNAVLNALASEVSAEIAASDARLTPVTAEKSSEPDIYDIARDEVLAELTKPSPAKSIQDDIRAAYESDVDLIIRELRTNEGDDSSTENLAHSESDSGSGKSSRSDELLDSGIKPAPAAIPVKEILTTNKDKAKKASSAEFPTAKSKAVSKKTAATMPELDDDTSHPSKANTAKEKFDHLTQAAKEKVEALKESIKEKAEAARQAAKNKAEVVLKKISKKHARSTDEELFILNQAIEKIVPSGLKTALSNLTEQLGSDLGGKKGRAKENSSAAQLLRDTNKMMAEITRTPAADEFKDNDEYHQHLKATKNKFKRSISPSNLKKFGKAVAAVLSALGGLFAGAVIGGGIGIGAGAWSGPGAVATGVAGVFTGAATGAGIGLVAGATAVGITAGTVSGIFLFKKPSPAARTRRELAKALVKEVSEENQNATLVTPAM